jgi:hypothetical protein
MDVDEVVHVAKFDRDREREREQLREKQQHERQVRDAAEQIKFDCSGYPAVVATRTGSLL